MSRWFLSFQPTTWIVNSSPTAHCPTAPIPAFALVPLSHYHCQTRPTTQCSSRHCLLLHCSRCFSSLPRAYPSSRYPLPKMAARAWSTPARSCGQANAPMPAVSAPCAPRESCAISTASEARNARPMGPRATLRDIPSARTASSTAPNGSQP